MSTVTGMTRMPSAASFTSRACIFLPRYSGVRPTISPPMNTVMMAKSKIEYRPVPTPPGETSPSIMPVSAANPPMGVKESSAESTLPVDVWVDAIA
jgi:hypothetical protein